MASLPEWVQSARDQWHWKGQARPPFAELPGPGQVSVWDFPRPPKLVRDTRHVVVKWEGLTVADTRNAVLVLETAHPPSVYIPWADVARHLLVAAPGTSLCEWKGPARYWTLSDGARRLTAVAWSYPDPLAGAEALAGGVAFYSARLQCTVDGHAVRPQPGGFYGGWITPDLAGPFKGSPGTEAW